MLYRPTVSELPCDYAFERIGRWFDVEYGDNAGLALVTAAIMLALDSEGYKIDAKSAVTLLLGKESK